SSTWARLVSSPMRSDLICRMETLSASSPTETGHRMVCMGSLPRWGGGSGRQARVVDHEAVAHVALEHALVCLVDLVGADHLDVGHDPVFGAEVEHLLRLRDPADQRTGQAAALHDQVEHLR